MSISSWLTFDLRDRAIPEDAVVTALMDGGWTAHRDGLVEILPLGDNGDFGWEERRLGRDELMAFIQSKRSAGELVGITLWWQSSEIGGNFLIDSESKLKVSLSINRVTLPGVHRHTDVSWYLARLLPALEKIGGASAIEWSELA